MHITTYHLEHDELDVLQELKTIEEEIEIWSIQFLGGGSNAMTKEIRAVASK